MQRGRSLRTPERLEPPPPAALVVTQQVIVKGEAVMWQRHGAPWRPGQRLDRPPELVPELSEPSSPNRTFHHALNHGEFRYYLKGVFVVVRHPDRFRADKSTTPCPPPHEGEGPGVIAEAAYYLMKCQLCRQHRSEQPNAATGFPA